MTRARDLSGPVGRAWRLAAEPHVACLASYLVHRPGAHPLWSCYLVAVCHLRPIEGMPPPALHFPEATHEITFISFDPEDMPEPDPARWPNNPPKHLIPLDLVWQGVMTDDEAERVVADAVRVIVLDPRVSPDSDFRAWWKIALPRTLEHYRTGGHA